MRICRVFLTPTMDRWLDMQIGNENAAQMWQRAMSENVLCCDMWAVSSDAIIALIVLDVIDMPTGKVMPFSVVPPQGEPPKAS